MDYIYTITGLDENKGLTPLSTRCFGWFPSEKLASNLIMKNSGDMQEGKHLWLVVEEYSWGVFPPAKNESWWEWIEDKDSGFWVECKKPEDIPSTIMNWGMA